MGFRLSLLAEEDVIRIAEEGILIFGPAQARKYHRELYAVFHLLSLNPRMARERHELSPPLRIHRFRSHLVVYSVDADDEVFIVRVRHGHEDWVNEP
ncbi:MULTISPECIES: type II toxin-antitoxin system RelE/ParE family toxin [Agrobacterium]|uniref:Type II toxin-antitoxin system RelE/ParE family toxin n=1 Tax=Agrobacterium tumefaciens TaxID=358 RepID=A0AAE6B838_AGRTU|nr:MULTISPECIES: type II toxin-antitoxin system RelE/ParE family toxin [Agrobacterium]QCL72496.1 type II toxin-antitoxin system RelE/ParE family toxin [Agrobacterium tumefaciens]QCL78068.1 type II toxin-antitoxin system RelE/ParE family toxin [Agrobacterium tumefaciens]CUX18410.1 Toxin ParE4 [Agrobacterium sp. NCPPB 925]